MNGRNVVGQSVGDLITFVFYWDRVTDWFLSLGILLQLPRWGRIYSQHRRRLFIIRHFKDLRRLDHYRGLIEVCRQKLQNLGILFNTTNLREAKPLKLRKSQRFRFATKSFQDIFKNDLESDLKIGLRYSHDKIMALENTTIMHGALTKLSVHVHQFYNPGELSFLWRPKSASGDLLDWLSKKKNYTQPWPRFRSGVGTIFLGRGKMGKIWLRLDEKN